MPIKGMGRQVGGNGEEPRESEGAIGEDEAGTNKEQDLNEEESA